MHQDNILQFSFEPLKPQWEQQAINVIVTANLESFPLLKSGSLKPEDFQKQTKRLYKQTLSAQQQANKHLKTQTQFNHVLRCKGEIIAVMFSIDYVIYYNMISNLFEKNQYYGLYKEISIEDMPIGKRVYFTRLSVKPQWMRKGTGKRMLYQVSKYLKEKGYDRSYAGVVSPVSQKLFCKMGGKLVVSREFKSETNSFEMKIFYSCLENTVEQYESATKLKESL